MLLLAACTRVPPPEPITARDLDGPARMVLTESSGDHGRLIVIDETGDRLAPLLVPGTTAAGAPATDEHPAFSPDGRWIVFASDRGREAGARSLWLAAARPDAAPVQLTRDSADIDPTWDASGAVVFASDRAGAGSFDLWRLPLRDGVAAAAPERLTDAPTHEVAPSAAAGRLVLQVVDAAAGRSWIAERLADGALIALTDGPADGTPALAPDGRRLAHATAQVHADGARDLDIIVVNLESGAAELGIALSASDEGAPAWSADGRWLFATSVIRDDDGTPLLPSVVHRDTWSPRRPIRMLRDRAGASPRLGVAVSVVTLDQTSLGRNLDHATALRHALLDLAAAAAAARESDKR